MSIAIRFGREPRLAWVSAAGSLARHAFLLTNPDDVVPEVTARAVCGVDGLPMPAFPTTSDCGNCRSIVKLALAGMVEVDS